MQEFQKTEAPPIPVVPNFIRAEAATGDLRLHEFRSRTFRNTRFVRVWLPPGYDDPANQGTRYPVLYLNDGQNLFEAASSFTHVEWQVDETADRLIREGVIPSMIIVGLDNTGKNRIREYVPHRSLHPMMMRVRGGRYPDFLIKEIMPFVGRYYRVATGPENTGLGGSSLGALIALYTGASRPDVVGHLLLESPSLWVSHRQIITESREVKIWPQRIYLATGTTESGREDVSRSMVDDVRELAGIFRRAGLGDDRMELVIDEGGTHHESAWARRFPEALRFLYGNR
ncbi:MAG: alpha/beta hydrolase-fold protein [Candidatus Sulfotelmatobacter sp.]